MYLTLGDDEVPDNEQDETVREETIVLSYKEHIIGWLKKCIASVVLVPTIRETLVQYSNLIKTLTGRPLNEEEIMETNMFIVHKFQKKNFKKFYGIASFALESYSAQNIA